MPGIEPGPPRLSPRTVRPPYWWSIIDQLRPIRNWGGQTDLHRYQRRHGAQCCCYTMTTIFKRGVGSSECRMPERYTNRFPAQPIPQSSFRTLHLNGAPGRTRTDEYEFTKLALWLLRHRGRNKVRNSKSEANSKYYFSCGIAFGTGTPSSPIDSVGHPKRASSASDNSSGVEGWR